MSFADSEVNSQPACWRDAATVAPKVAAYLPAPGERVAVTGCGTSYYMAKACALLREQRGRGETDAFPASEFPAHRAYDRVIAITRSGTTTELIRLLKRLGPSSPTTVITTSSDLPVVEWAAHAVILDFADERSVVQTRFATSTLALWRAHLGEPLEELAKSAEDVLRRPLPHGLLDHRQFVFLASGWGIGVADEAGLKLREGAQAWTESYPAMEYRHGPISVADRSTLVWMFGDAPPGLLGEVEATGAQTVHHGLDPMVDLVDAQRLALALADRRGLDPDTPRHLSRSIILADGA